MKVRVGIQLVGAAILLAAHGSASAQTAGAAPVAFVGCPADGQMGPVPAPKTVHERPLVPATAAGRLAYYATEHLGVLAPRGWHCMGLYGSSGSFLFVTPQRQAANDLLQQDAGFTGPVVELLQLYGGTSGRFEVARIAARLFPIARSFVQQVIDENVEPREDFPFGPYPDDSLVRRSATIVEFMTPAGHDGIGTTGRLAKSDLTISGVAMLFAAEMNIVKRSVRLPPELADLAPTVTATAERDRGGLAVLRGH